MTKKKIKTKEKLTTHYKLKKDFDTAIKKLQLECPHRSAMWYENWHGPGHSSGYKSFICKRCKKTLKEDPTVSTRGAIQ